MTWEEDIAAANVETRLAVRDLIERGMTANVEAGDIAAALVELGVFDDSRVDLGKADIVPIVNVYPAIHVNVEPTPVHVDAPVVNVDAPIVNIAQAEAKAALVIPAPVVNVTPELRITSMPDRVTSRKVERDKEGRITRTLDVESDA